MMRSLLAKWLTPRPTEPEPCSDWCTEDELSAALTARKAKRPAAHAAACKGWDTRRGRG